jgi:hypothetical protein
MLRVILPSWPVREFEIAGLVRVTGTSGLLWNVVLSDLADVVLMVSTRRVANLFYQGRLWRLRCPLMQRCPRQDPDGQGPRKQVTHGEPWLQGEEAKLAFVNDRGFPQRV